MITKQQLKKKNRINSLEEQLLAQADKIVTLIISHQTYLLEDIVEYKILQKCLTFLKDTPKSTEEPTAKSEEPTAKPEELMTTLEELTATPEELTMTTLNTPMNLSILTPDGLTKTLNADVISPLSTERSESSLETKSKKEEETLLNLYTTVADVNNSSQSDGYLLEKKKKKDDYSVENPAATMITKTGNRSISKTPTARKGPYVNNQQKRSHPDNQKFQQGGLTYKKSRTTFNSKPNNNSNVRQPRPPAQPMHRLPETQ